MTAGTSSSSPRRPISGDGRFVAFNSDATNLVAADTNGEWDIFVRDLCLGVTTRVSVASDGTQGDNISYPPDISSDVRYVAFFSLADNLVPGDTNNTWDVFVHDRYTHRTSRASVTSHGNQANGASQLPSISGNGQAVVYESGAANLVPPDTNQNTDAYLSRRITPWRSGSARTLARGTHRGWPRYPCRTERWGSAAVHDRPSDASRAGNRRERGWRRAPTGEGSRLAR